MLHPKQLLELHTTTWYHFLRLPKMFMSMLHFPYTVLYGIDFKFLRHYTLFYKAATNVRPPKPERRYWFLWCKTYVPGLVGCAICSMSSRLGKGYALSLWYANSKMEIAVQKVEMCKGCIFAQISKTGKSKMRKKVALLLAFIMVISMLPMNVFGNPVVGFAGSSVTQGFYGRNQEAEFTVRLPLNAVWPMLVRGQPTQGDWMRAVIALEHSYFNLGTIPEGGLLLDSTTVLAQAGHVPSNTQAVNLPPEAFEVRIMAVVDRQAVLDIRFIPGTTFYNNANPAVALTGNTNSWNFVGPSGFIDFNLNLRSANNDNWVNSNMTIAGQGAEADNLQTFLSRAPLVWRHEGRINWSVYGGPRGFTSALRLNPIRIDESAFGHIVHNSNGRVTVRLEAPPFYTWSFGLPEGVALETVGQAGNITPGRPGTLYPLEVATTRMDAELQTVRSVREAGTEDRHRVYLEIDVTQSGLFNPLTGRIELRNLWLIPDANAAEAGNVYIDVAIGRWHPATTGTAGQAQTPDTTTNVYQRENLFLVGEYTNLYVGDTIAWVAPSPAANAATAGTFVPAGRGWRTWGNNPNTAAFGENPTQWTNGVNGWVALTTQMSFEVQSTPVAGHRQLVRPDNVPENYIPVLVPGAPRGTEAAFHWNDLVASPAATALGAGGTTHWFISGDLDRVRVNPTQSSALYDVIAAIAAANAAPVPVANRVNHMVNPDFTLPIFGGFAFVTEPAGARIQIRTATRHDVPRVDEYNRRILWGTTFNPGNPGTDGEDAQGVRWTHWHRGWDARLHVGIRGGATLTASVYNMQYMRTGHLGTPRGITGALGNVANPGVHTVSGQWNNVEGVNWVPGNRDNAGLPHFTGVPTATLIIEEDSPGAFSVGFGTPIHFDFLDDDGNPHPGVRVLGVQARAGNDNIGRYRGNFRGFFEGGSAANGFSNADWNRERQNWMTFAGWMNALDNRLPVAPGVGRVSADGRTTIYLPSQTISDVGGPAALEIRFWLSLEAGYEWKYGDGVYVTISGGGVSNLQDEYRRVRVGNAVDPIQTNVTGGTFPVLEVETGRLYNIVGRTALSDVEIDIIDPNAFRMGQELWVYVTSDVLARAGDVSLAGIPTINVEGSTLRFDSGRFVQTQVVGGNTAVAFTVIRTATAGDEPVATISNLAVEGSVFPGINYQIVVTGPSIANNEQSIFDQFMGNAHGGVLRHMNRGVFTSLPYHGTFIVNASDGLGNFDGSGPQVGPTGREFRLVEGVPFGGVAEPLIWNIVGPNRVGMVSMRAFAVLIGANPEQDIVWNSADRIAEVRGLHFDGVTPIGVAVRIGGTGASVMHGDAHREVDIATAVNFLSGPAGSVTPLVFNDHVYLPLRFMAETFGWTVERQGNVVIFR